MLSPGLTKTTFTKPAHSNLAIAMTSRADLIRITLGPPPTHGHPTQIPLAQIAALHQRAALLVNKEARWFDGPGGMREDLLQTCFLTGLVGVDPAMLHVMEQIALCTAGGVLVTGEIGTEKMAVARCLHALADAPPATFIQATGRDLSQDLIDEAAGGTLFIDRLEEVPAAQQTRLLQAVEGGRLRLVAGTAMDLEQQLHEGTILVGLYHYLKDRIQLPPLCLRPGDLPLLIYRIIKNYNRERRIQRLLPDAPPEDHKIGGVYSKSLYRALAHRWPGNMIELEHCVHGECTRAIVQHRIPCLHLDDPPHWIFAPDPHEELEDRTAWTAQVEDEPVLLDDLLDFDLAELLNGMDRLARPEYRRLWTYEQRAAYLQSETVEEGEAGDRTDEATAVDSVASQHPSTPPPEKEGQPSEAEPSPITWEETADGLVVWLDDRRYDRFTVNQTLVIRALLATSRRFLSEAFLLEGILDKAPGTGRLRDTFLSRPGYFSENPRHTDGALLIRTRSKQICFNI